MGNNVSKKQRVRHTGIDQVYGISRPASLAGNPMEEVPSHPPYRVSDADRERFRELDLAIANGWEDTPQEKLPADWRTRKKVGVRVQDDSVIHGLATSYSNRNCRCDECRVAANTARLNSYRRRRTG